MVYGRPPFHALSAVIKIREIPNPKHEIVYPEYTSPLILGNMETPDQPREDERTKVPIDIINSIRLCLVRDPKKRATIPQLQAQAWITGGELPVHRYVQFRGLIRYRSYSSRRRPTSQDPSS